MDSKNLDTIVKARLTTILKILNILKRDADKAFFTFENISVQPGWLGSSPPGRRTRKLRISDSEITPVTLDGAVQHFLKRRSMQCQPPKYEITMSGGWSASKKVLFCWKYFVVKTTLLWKRLSCEKLWFLLWKYFVLKILCCEKYFLVNNAFVVKNTLFSSSTTTRRWTSAFTILSITANSDSSWRWEEYIVSVDIKSLARTYHNIQYKFQHRNLRRINSEPACTYAPPQTTRSGAGLQPSG